MSTEAWRDPLRKLGVSPTYRTMRVLAAISALGLQLEHAIRAEDAAAARVLRELPEAFRGRLDRRAVAVLRAIGEEPWLTIVR